MVRMRMGNNMDNNVDNNEEKIATEVADAPEDKTGAEEITEATKEAEETAADAVEEAEEEADMVLSVIREMDNIELTYPIVYDWEIVTTDVARTDNISVKTLTECSVVFCEKIKQAGYIPMVYQNKRTSLLKLDLPELTDYDFWLAEYNDEATYYYNYQMWQYASDGTVPGVVGDVDVNICFKDYTNSENKESDDYA
mgnify:CR=1 FL=1